MEPRATSRRDELPTGSRYELLVKLASGGMATVYVGRSTAAISRLFAIKRAHSHLVDDPVFRKMFVVEGRLAARIHHPNVVSVQDVAELEDELLLVMDYVEGLSLVELAIADEQTRVSVAVRIVLDVCAGLHAAHELCGDDGQTLGIVHRDVSPHNILVGVDGVARITDFGVAKSELHTGNATVTGALKGKLAYMAPEYIESGKADRRADVYALGVVLWETLTAARLFRGSSELEVMRLVLSGEINPPSSRAELVPPALDAVVGKALARAPEERYQSADAFADALEQAARTAGMLASHRQVAAVVETLARDVLQARRDALRARTNKEPEPAAEAELTEPERTETLAAPRTPAPEPAPTPAPAATIPVTTRGNAGRIAVVCVGGVVVLGLGIAALRASPAQVIAPPPSTSAADPVAMTSVAPGPSPQGQASLSAATSASAAPPLVLSVVSSVASSVALGRPPLPRAQASASASPTPSVAPPNPYKRQ
jgi:serine/threonine-protein kinase